MKSVPIFLALAGAQLLAPATAPVPSNEQLRFSVNWPTGLSLGDASLRASRTKTDDKQPARLDLAFDIDASIPGFSVSDRFHSAASQDFCSLEFNKNTQHGKKKTEEKTVFDSDTQTAIRETSGGGKSTLKTETCAKDALAFLYFLRRELGQGRLPPRQAVFFGSPYQIRVEFAGTQNIQLADGPVEADRLKAFLKGPSSDLNFEVFFLKDAARTPALVKVPLQIGTFTMELVRQP